MAIWQTIKNKAKVQKIDILTEVIISILTTYMLLIPSTIILLDKKLDIYQFIISLFLMISTCIIPKKLAKFKEVNDKTYSIINNLSNEAFSLSIIVLLCRTTMSMSFICLPLLVVVFILWTSALVLGLVYETKDEVVKTEIKDTKKIKLKNKTKSTTKKKKSK